jgi:hypothetical protein
MVNRDQNNAPAQRDVQLRKVFVYALAGSALGIFTGLAFACVQFGIWLLKAVAH